MIIRVRWARSRAVVFAVLFVGGAVDQASAQRTPGATAGSLAVDDSSPAIERSSCVLMLKRSLRYSGPGLGPPAAGTSGLADLTALTTAMTTTGLIDPAAKAALGLGPREWPKVVRIEVAPAGTQAVKLSVIVNLAPNSLKQPEPAGADPHPHALPLLRESPPDAHPAPCRLTRVQIHRHEVPRKALHASVGLLTLSLYATGYHPSQIHPALLTALVPITAVDVLFRSVAATFGVPYTPWSGQAETLAGR